MSLSLSPAFSPTLCALPFDYSYLAGVSLTATASCNDCVMHLCLVVFLCCVETNVSSLAPSCSNNSRGKPPTAQLYHTDSFHVCYLFFWLLLTLCLTRHSCFCKVRCSVPFVLLQWLAQQHAVATRLCCHVKAGHRLRREWSPTALSTP